MKKLPQVQRVTHQINPVFDDKSEILILGTFPSVKSREDEFFYAHPQNRFWAVVSAVMGCVLPVSTDEKKSFLLANHIALWDVISSCDIVGSSDSSIKNVVPNDIELILKTADIKRIFVNGKTADKLFDRYIKKEIGREAVCLPSTSPANAAWKFDQLVEAWSIIKTEL